MLLLLLAFGVWLTGSVAALVLGRSHWGARLGASATVAGCAIALVPALRGLAGTAEAPLRMGWQVPYGAFVVEIDPLSAVFLLPILGVCALAAVYGLAYLAVHGATRRVGASWCFFNLLVAAMVLVVTARNAVLFLVAWELMALASFFLVTFEDETRSVRDAGWLYLVATHLGTACLLALFVLLGPRSGPLDFDRFSPASAPAGLLFLLAVIGFGSKAGFMPLHVWLPEAHPAAPSHVSAVMSAVMIKTGIYGLVRTLTFLGPPPAWWGWLLCALGVASGVLGLLFALAQHDLKRLLAYSSVENVGIIALGLGLGTLGLSAGSAPLAVLGFAGALLHVWNHALFKALLFLGAGAVAHGTGTRDMNRLGGLLARMPRTGSAFVIGALAICGLPPLNGFAGEFLLYLGAVRGVAEHEAGLAVPLLAAIAGLALIGGLAAACFSNAVGAVFLGEPRSGDAARAHEPRPAMQVPMLLLAASCVAIGCLAPLVLGALAPAIETVSRLPEETVRGVVGAARGPLTVVAAAALGVLGLSAALALLRQRLLSGRTVEQHGTWDCGYARPSPRMQYTASSFAQPLTELFRLILQRRGELTPPAGLFPDGGAFDTATPDVCAQRVYAPLFTAIGRGLAGLRWLQHGQVQLYVLYIALTLVVLLVWKLG